LQIHTQLSRHFFGFFHSPKDVAVLPIALFRTAVHGGKPSRILAQLLAQFLHGSPQENGLTAHGKNI